MNDGIRQHKRIAMGSKEDGGASGVKPLSSFAMSTEQPTEAEFPEAMSNGERGAGMPIHHSKDKLPAQAAPDHGDHFGDGMHSAKGHVTHSRS